MRPFVHRRANVPAFQETLYYTFHNANGGNNTLSAGSSQDTKGAIGMTPYGGRSSENWQLYYQGGRYFIRNYDYLGTWQLGLTEGSLVTPKLIKPATGELGQQWSMIKNSDGTFRFVNGLLGNDSALALAQGNTVPVMQQSLEGTAWSILGNPSALVPKDPSMLVDVQNFELDPSLTSSSSIAPSATSSTVPSGTASSTSTKPANNLASSTSSPTSAPLTGAVSSKSSSLAPGAIAGIAVGIVLLLALFALLGYFLWARRKPKQPKQPKVTAELGASEHKGYYAHHGQLGQQAPQQQAAYAQYGTPAAPPQPTVFHEMGPAEPAAAPQSQGRDVKQPYVVQSRVAEM